MSNYSMYMQCETILVFDAYLVPGGEGSRLDYHGIKVVYTKENETGDAYIEKLLANIGRNDRVRVITGDGLIQLAAWRQGVMRMSAREFEKDVDAAYERMRKMLKDIGNVDPVTFGEKLRQALEKMRHCGYTAIPVIHRDGRYAGTVSEGDFLWYLSDRLNENNSVSKKNLEEIQIVLCFLAKEIL